ncbi:hypothetical protein EDD11_003432 [Mortierella claussenii]|nr:hypothetical protein EDD11_003432 [Mortierella claussenii]
MAKKNRNRSRLSTNTNSNNNSNHNQHSGELTPIEDLTLSSATNLTAVVVSMQPPTPSSPTAPAFRPTQVSPEAQAQVEPAVAPPSECLVGSPEPMRYKNSKSQFCSGSTSAANSNYQNARVHTHEFTEPTIGERFGRRHGQDWPTGSHGVGRCASCPITRTESQTRSKSCGRMRRTSGVLYKVIPSKPVLGHEVFQKARKSEEEIKAMKASKQVQGYYRSMNEVLDSFAEVEAILKEHREEENAQSVTLPQLPSARTQDSLLSTISPTSANNNNQSDFSYGSTSRNAASDNTLKPSPLTPGDPDLKLPPKDDLSASKSYGHSNTVISDNSQADLEEGTPLLNYKRRSRTSPRLVSLAINVSFLANIFLVVIKIWTVLLSDSLAVLASMIDSLMDLLSGAIIWYSARLRSNTSDGHRYPVGKARMEPLGIIVFAVVMVTSFLQVMLQAFERLVEGSEEPPVDLGLIILTLLALNILVKFALWVWCRTMKDSSSVQALAQDHLNDVVFNVFSTLFPVAGQFLGIWWLDAAGAVLLSIYIITEWTGTCLHNIRRLTGQAATAADIQQLTYMTYRFSNTIQVIDTVRAYSVGEGLFAEIDIVLPPDTPLSQAHDLGESLQGALERLDNVERAFVHVDYNAVHAIEHR